MVERGEGGLADAQQIIQMAKDVDGRHDAVDAIVATVPELEAIVKRGRAELAQREVEQMERLFLKAELDAMQHKLAEKKNAIQKMMDVACWTSHVYAVEKMLQDVISLKGRAQGGEIADLRADIHDVSEHMKFVVHAIDTQLIQAKKAHQEKFTRRLQSFNQGADAKQSKGSNGKPESFLQDEGLSAHEGSFLELLQIIFCLREARAPRSAVQRCLNQWVKSVWSGEYDASICMSLRSKDEPAGANATHPEPQKTKQMTVAQQQQGQSNACVALSQDGASKQPRELSSNDGHIANKAAAIHAAASLTIRQTTPSPPRQSTPWQAAVGPVLRMEEYDTNGETPTAAPKPRANSKEETVRQVELSDLPRGITPPPSASFQQTLESRPRQAKVRLNGCICRFAFLLIGFACGWMSSKIRMDDAPGLSTACCPPKQIRIVPEFVGNFFKGRGMHKSRVVHPYSKRRRS